MKKLLLSICLLPSYFLIAQEVHPVSGEPLKYCGQTEATQELYKNYPYLKNAAEIIQQQQEQQKVNPETNQPPVYTIPVVVHILHNYGSENIPDANVKDAIRILNEDFRKLNADTTNVVDAFKSLVADAEIEFQLAKLDPLGNCTNGIDRIATPKTYKAGDGQIGSNVSKINMWPRDKYLNIYTVNNIYNGSAGYTYVPATVNMNTQSSIDGIIILYNYFGSLAPSSASTSRALTHEVGHWINLFHTWGTTNNPGVSCGDDSVSDTPITMGWTSCNLTTNENDVCTSGIEENVQNYMEYSYCYRMFTTGQVSRMRSALTSSTAQRNNLWTTANLAATGVSTADQLCTADFKVSNTVVCVDTSITFTDLSWNGTMTSWQWDFDNNSTTDATTQNPTYSYSAAGTYSVTLTVGDGVTTKTVTKPSLIVVLENTASMQAPFSEGFENSGYPYSDWNNASASSNSNVWTRVTTAAYTGSASLKLDNYSPTSGDIDEFITPSIDVSTVTTPTMTPTMTFWVAYQRRSSTDTLDQLRVLTSTDCGKSWVQRYSKSEATTPTLETVSTTSGSAFTPSSTSEWRQENVPIANVSGKTNVRFRFEFTGHGVGNNIYIDDVNISGKIVGINENEDHNDFLFSVYPNLVDETTTVSFTLKTSRSVSIGIYDLVGKEIVFATNSNLSAGTYEFPLNGSILKAGIYFVKFDAEGHSVVRKIVVH